MNPILPLQYFIPDVKTRQWQDGRLYLYRSYDISGGTTYCSYEYHVFSSADLLHWEHHGESFRSTGPNSQVPWAVIQPGGVFFSGSISIVLCSREEGPLFSDTRR